ncbi:hypothetical protein KJ673_02800 [Patescibacteria group bacterium]|nr:hypothetical protein [Patescibacteria group bacterium]MBU4452876.1 hypothetical protein [Patescibacteria group bacterium]MCG2687817.1 hypothetical protein [Candidatus Parcubacteria bacterium]
MSWFNQLFGKCDEKCCNDGCDCGGEEKQDMDPVDEPIEPTPAEPIEGDETPVVE